MKDKHDLILVFYVNVGNMSNEDIAKYMENVKKNVNDRVKNVISFFCPIRKGDMRVECINPVFMTKKEYDEIVQGRLNKIEMDFFEYIESTDKRKKKPVEKPTPIKKTVEKPVEKPVEVKSEPVKKTRTKK